jgi:hypothetical protein
MVSRGDVEEWSDVEALVQTMRCGFLYILGALLG